jgi:hypothetical protein
VGGLKWIERTHDTPAHCAGKTGVGLSDRDFVEPNTHYRSTARAIATISRCTHDRKHRARAHGFGVAGVEYIWFSDGVNEEIAGSRRIQAKFALKINQ